MLFPLYLMVLISFRTADRAFVYPPDLWFTSVTFDNYPQALFKRLPFRLYVQNTVIIAVLVIIGDLLSARWWRTASRGSASPGATRCSSSCWPR